MSGLQQLDSIDYSQVRDIVGYLKNHPVENTKYRTNIAPIARSQTYGIVQRRSLPPDLSRSSWRHPQLFKMLLDFAEKNVQIPFTSIQVNDNVVCARHKDKNNKGLSYIVAFSDETGFEGGKLWCENQSYDINLRPLLFDGSMMLHGTEPFRGVRYSIVFHTILPKSWFVHLVPPLNTFSVVEHNGRKKVFDKRTNSYYWGTNGLPHPLKNRVRPSAKSS